MSYQEKFKDVVDWLKANSEKSKVVAKSGLFGDKKLLFSGQENNKATVQSEYGTVSTKPGPQTNSSFLTTSPQSSAAPFSVFQKPPSTSKFLIRFWAWFSLRKLLNFK